MHFSTFMHLFDAKETKMLSELIRNPRSSDNKIASRAKLPVATVNRKRKELEQRGILTYFAHVNNWKDGTQVFSARQMYMIKLRYGITRKQFLDAFYQPGELTPLFLKHVVSSDLGEMNGQLVFIITVESRIDTDILEIFNAEIAPMLDRHFGKGSIQESISLPLTQSLTMLHNYNKFNLDSGKIRDNWPNDKVFVQ